MTGNSNPLLVGEGRGKAQPAFVKIGNDQVPTEIDAYALWLSAHVPRRGRWIVISRNDHKTIDWVPEFAPEGRVSEQR